jgi:hypothetical protein
MTNQRLPAIVDYLNPVHHRAQVDKSLRRPGRSRFSPLGGRTVQNRDIPTEVLAKHYVAIGVSVPEVVSGDTPTENTAPVITLGEEEISDVSLATFYVFDNENAGAHRPGLQLARGRGHGGCAVRRGCTGCAVTCGGCGGCGGGPGRPRRRRAGWSVGRYQRHQPQMLGSLLCDACPRETRFCAVETASREISVCTRLRGGAGRTRTSNQTVIAETRVNQGSPH